MCVLGHAGDEDAENEDVEDEDACLGPEVPILLTLQRNMASSDTGRGSDSISCHGKDGGVSGHVGDLGSVPSSSSIHEHDMACHS